MSTTNNTTVTDNNKSNQIKGTSMKTEEAKYFTANPEKPATMITPKLVRYACNNAVKRIHEHNNGKTQSIQNTSTHKNHLQLKAIRAKALSTVAMDSNLLESISTALNEVNNVSGSENKFVQQHLGGMIASFIVSSPKNHFKKINSNINGVSWKELGEESRGAGLAILEELQAIVPDSVLEKKITLIKGSKVNAKETYYHFPVRPMKVKVKDMLKGLHFISDLKKGKVPADKSKHTVKELMGAEAFKISPQTKVAQNFLKDPKAAIKLSIDKDLMFEIAKHSKAFIMTMEEEMRESQTHNTIIEKRMLDELLLEVNEVHEALTNPTGFVANTFLDLTGRFYSKNNKYSLIAVQAGGKLLYNSVEGEVINKEGFKQLMISAGQMIGKKTSSKKAIEIYNSFDTDEERFEAILATNGEMPTAEYTLLDFKTNEKAYAEIYARTSDRAEGPVVMEELTKEERKVILMAFHHEIYEENRSIKADAYDKVAKWLKEDHYLGKLIQAIKDYHTKTVSHFILLKDFAAGGLIWWSMALGSEKMAKIAHVYGNCSEFNDPYIFIIKEIFRLMGITTPSDNAVRTLRDQIKETLQAILHGGTFKTAASALRQLANDNPALGGLAKLKESELKSCFVSIFGEKILLIELFTTWTNSIYTTENPSLSWNIDGRHGQTLGRGAKSKYTIDDIYTPDTVNSPRGVKQVKFITEIPFSEIGGEAVKGVEVEEEYSLAKVLNDMAKGNPDHITEYESARLRGASANFLHYLDPMAVEAIATLLQGGLFEVIHDNFGTHPNNMSLVAQGAKNAMHKINKGVEQADGTFKPYLQHVADQICDKANERLSYFANMFVVDKISKELALKAATDGTPFDKAEFDRLCKEQYITPTRTVSRFVCDITPLDDKEIGKFDHFLQV